ncbi:MAG: hypothetical protein A2491_07065 [Bacteroidetes bacterium RIFOXYC12_FULL_35_7]|nr:MAG: hypothetical protein A2491_07065 [Bacteroidetes bacterium RIFOXYC12_FULL_35_7]
MKTLKISVLILISTCFIIYLSCKKDSSVATPDVSTNSVTSITSTTATCGGNVTDDGGSSVSACGVCWSTSQTPTISSYGKTSDGTGTGAFTSNLTGLTANTTYYVRAYATNSKGTDYGNQVTFATTGSSSGTVTVTTNSISSITSTTAYLSGSVYSTGTGTLYRGFAIGTQINPTYPNFATGQIAWTYDGSGTGTFSRTYDGLQSNTTYYVRAFANDDNNNVWYGANKTFTTSAGQTQICAWTSSSTFPCSSARIDIYIDDVYKGYLSSYYTSTPSCGASGTVTVNTTAGSHKFFARCNSGSTTWGPSYYTVSSGSCFKWQLN